MASTTRLSCKPVARDLWYMSARVLELPTDITADKHACFCHTSRLCQNLSNLQQHQLLKNISSLITRRLRELCMQAGG